MAQVTEAREATPTPGLNLERLEEAICKVVERFNNNEGPWTRRLNDQDRDNCLRCLCASIGDRYAGCTLGNFESYHERQAPVVSRLIEFAREIPKHCRDGSGLLLFGPAGTGKDHLLAAVLKIAIVAHRLRVRWYDGQELFEQARYAIRRETEHELRAMLTEPHILAISDPQPPKGDLSDYQISLVRDVIDRRYRRCLSTWITTNLDKSDDANRLLTEPVMQRLKESSGKIFCDWPNYREQQKAAW